MPLNGDDLASPISGARKQAYLTCIAHTYKCRLHHFTQTKETAGGFDLVAGLLIVSPGSRFFHLGRWMSKH